MGRRPVSNLRVCDLEAVQKFQSRKQCTQRSTVKKVEEAKQLKQGALRGHRCLTVTGGQCNLAVVEKIAALRGHAASFAQAAVTETQQRRDPKKTPCTATDGVNKPVPQEREQRAQNGDVKCAVKPIVRGIYAIRSSSIVGCIPPLRPSMRRSPRAVIRRITSSSVLHARNTLWPALALCIGGVELREVRVCEEGTARNYRGVGEDEQDVERRHDVVAVDQERERAEEEKREGALGICARSEPGARATPWLEPGDTARKVVLVPGNNKPERAEDLGVSCVESQLPLCIAKLTSVN
ncbi:hypothetical protein DFH06DRAFT_1308856 [Mycena polygramma]|nr:hypothetical protein DFH06DRAFT_1308856 [Mycena polygramma]